MLLIHRHALELDYWHHDLIENLIVTNCAKILNVFACQNLGNPIDVLHFETSTEIDVQKS